MLSVDARAPARGIFTLALAVAAAACAGETGRAGQGEWLGTMDTLPSGAIHVRNPEAGIWDSASTWRIVEDLRIGSEDSEGPDMFGNVADIAVDDWGRIYVLEDQAQEIRVFGPDGEFIRTIGREGSGPGEFSNAMGIRMRGNGQFWVPDQRNARYSLFDTSGTYLRANRRESGFYLRPWTGFVDSAGNLVERTLTMNAAGNTRSPLIGQSVLISFDSLGVAVDTVFLPVYEGRLWTVTSNGGQSRMSAGVPFSPFQVLYPDPRGYLWFGVNDQYRFVQATFDRDTIRIIEREATPREVTSEEIDEQLENMDWFTNQGGTIDRADIPGVHTLFGQIFVGPDAHIWVRPTLPTEENGFHFDIFDPEGRYLGRTVSDVRVGARTPPIIRGDTLYTVTTDSLDIQYVVRARILKGGNDGR